MKESIISEGEAGCLLVKAFPEELARRISTRLETKFVDHPPGKLYKLKEVCDGALWVAEGLTQGETGGGASGGSVAKAEAPVAVKSEPREMLAFAEALKGLTEAVQRMGQGPVYGGGGGGPASGSGGGRLGDVS